jgi:hypothetical protein
MLRAEASPIQASSAQLSVLALHGGRLDLARRHIKVLRRSPIDAIAGNGCMLAASLAMREGHAEEAHARLVDAVSHFEHARTRAALATARRRLGGLLGGDDGRRLREQADDWARAEHLVAPERIYDIICPWM